MKNKINVDSGKGPFVLRSDMKRPQSAVLNKSPSAHDEFAKALVKNETGQQLHVFDCVQIKDPIVDPTTDDDHERAFYSNIAMRVQLVDADDVSNVCIMQQPAEDERGAPALFTGISVARLTGETGKERATTVSGEVTLETSDNGPFEILHDPGPSSGERYGYVRFGGVGSGGGTISVRFEVITVTPSLRTAECDIQSIPASLAIGDIPGTSGITNRRITVCDPSGCYFNDSSAATILGVHGVASWRTPLVASPCQEGEYDEFSNQWEVDSLCCDLEPTCG